MSLREYTVPETGVGNDAGGENHRRETSPASAGGSSPATGRLPPHPCAAAEYRCERDQVGIAPGERHSAEPALPVATGPGSPHRGSAGGERRVVVRPRAAAGANGPPDEDGLGDSPAEPSSFPSGGWPKCWSSSWSRSCPSWPTSAPGTPSASGGRRARPARPPRTASQPCFAAANPPSDRGAF